MPEHTSSAAERSPRTDLERFSGPNRPEPPRTATRRPRCNGPVSRTGLPWLEPAGTIVVVGWLGSSTEPAMTSNPRRAHLAVIALAVTAIWGAVPFVALGVDRAEPIARAIPATGPWTGTVSVWRSSAFASQATTYGCTAAAVQMMLNLLLDRSRHDASEQATILSWEKAHDSLSGSKGSDPMGWAGAVRYFGGSRAATYRWARFTSMTGALRDAAYRLRMTGKPIGLLVRSGTHANVLVGFKATADPANGGTWSVTAAQIAGPWYPRTSPALDPPPGTWLSPSSLASRFNRYMETDGLSDWVGYWVTIVP
jgi:hypothetical protein